MGLSPFSWSSHPGPWLSVPTLSQDYHMLLWFPHSYNQILAIFSKNCMSKIQFLTSVFAQNMVPQTIFPIPGNSSSCHVKMFDSPDPLPFILSYLRSWVFTLACEFLYDLISSASVNKLTTLLPAPSVSAVLLLVWASRNGSTTGPLHLFCRPILCWQFITTSLLYFSP